ncbi:unnamed protein product (macronuclear) [Paramecium tetraurelia]|uniref:Uncharacterized protein n=1 Tax=Paramecium tetraurelia TaxID=5888 RepID=A0BNN9_PARTE|nr:uncharacterized protein GSPATT00030795001 [Paramecium tetraurelia]CAK60156.1 unnamed protein product [Paramecium tetraurelia]|eukprot:XP_001427554.1 hypothetical protein (macronuclear) [Paramecium tetraurelia strain d4-2]
MFQLRPQRTLGKRMQRRYALIPFHQGTCETRVIVALKRDMYARIVQNQERLRREEIVETRTGSEEDLRPPPPSLLNPPDPGEDIDNSRSNRRNRTEDHLPPARADPNPQYRHKALGIQNLLVQFKQTTMIQ